MSIRHHGADRLFHWSMALAVTVLLLSAFLPILGLQFDWIPWHWIAGVCLTLVVLFHIVRAVVWQGVSSMLPAAGDVRELWSGVATMRSGLPLLAAKYDAFQKSYHWVVALTVLALIATGLPMLIKLDTVFWDRNPGILSDIQWGYVYVVHGLASLLLIFLVLLHVYFSLLPEHKNLLKAMITGRGPLDVRSEEHS